MSLAAFIVSRYSQPDILHHYSNPAVKNKLKDDAKLIATKAKFLRSKIGERDKLACDYGVWFVTRGEEDLLFATCVENDYPERVAFGLIQKVQLMISEKDKNRSVEQRIGKLQKDINAVCDRYRDSRNDKVREAQAAVGELKDELQKGVRKMFDNQENLAELNDKAALMKNYAKTFEKNAETAEKTLFWHKWKMYIIIGGVLIIAFAACGIVLYFGSH